MVKLLFDLDISLGSMPQLAHRLSNSLEPHYYELKKRVQQAEIAGVDETPFRQECRTKYIWVVVSATMTLYQILPTRGLASLKGLRPREHLGATTTDRYGVYAYKKHQYCLAHIQRDFRKFSQREGSDRSYAEALNFELSEVFRAHRLYRTGDFNLEQMRSQVGYRRRRMRELLYDGFAHGSDRFSGFCDRLLTDFSRLFLFTRNPGVEPTNNACERALRPLVIYRKTSYGTQSDAGSRFLERVWSIWKTLESQGRASFDFLHECYLSRACPEKAPALFLTP